MNNPQKLIIAVTGASGSIYGKLLMQKLSEGPAFFDEVCVIFSENGRKVWQYELREETRIPSGFSEFSNDDSFAAPASGSAGYTHMVVCPCSMATLGSIAGGISTNLILRAADVMLKERRSLILVPREMPLSLVHIRNMETVTLAGAMVCPAAPSFYAIPATQEELLNSVIEKVLSLMGLPTGGYRWGTPR